MIFNDIPTLFGLLLVLHGMVVFVQDRRIVQLLIKTGAALLLGWQIYSLLLPFILLGLISDLFVFRRIRAVFRNSFLILAVFAVLFGTAVLTSSLANEYLVVGGRLQELPTFEMMLWRLGLGGPGAYEEHVAALNWPAFLKHQFYRIGRMSVPHIAVRHGGSPELFAVFGLGVFIVSLGAAALARPRILSLTLVLSGWCWALPMRHFVAFHDFQSIFYIGVPLVFFSALALRAARSSALVSTALTCSAALVFVLSGISLNSGKALAADTEKNVLTVDFQRIADRVGTGRAIFVDGDYHTLGGAHHAVGFYLAGNQFVSRAEDAEFIVSGDRIDGANLISRDNQRVFLYTRSMPESVDEGTTRSSGTGSAKPAEDRQEVK